MSEENNTQFTKSVFEQEPFTTVWSHVQTFESGHSLWKISDGSGHYVCNELNEGGVSLLDIYGNEVQFEDSSTIQSFPSFPDISFARSAHKKRVATDSVETTESDEYNYEEYQDLLDAVYAKFAEEQKESAPGAGDSGADSELESSVSTESSTTDEETHTDGTLKERLETAIHAGNQVHTHTKSNQFSLKEGPTQDADEPHSERTAEKGQPATSEEEDVEPTELAVEDEVVVNDAEVDVLIPENDGLETTDELIFEDSTEVIFETDVEIDTQNVSDEPIFDENETVSVDEFTDDPIDEGSEPLFDEDPIISEPVQSEAEGEDDLHNTEETHSVTDVGSDFESPQQSHVDDEVGDEDEFVVDVVESPPNEESANQSGPVEDEYSDDFSNFNTESTHASESEESEPESGVDGVETDEDVHAGTEYFVPESEEPVIDFSPESDYAELEEEGDSFSPSFDDVSSTSKEEIEELGEDSTSFQEGLPEDTAEYETVDDSVDERSFETEEGVEVDSTHEYPSITEFDWRTSINVFTQQVSAAREGDVAAQSRLKSAPRRALSAIRSNSNTTSVAVAGAYGLVFTIACALTILAAILLPAESQESQFFTEPSRYADLLLVTNTLTLFGIVAGYAVSKAHRPRNQQIAAHFGTGALLSVPVSLLVFISGTFLLGQTSAFVAFERLWVTIRTEVYESLPNAAIPVFEVYTNQAPLGVTISQIAGLSMLLGSGLFVVVLAEVGLRVLTDATEMPRTESTRTPSDEESVNSFETGGTSHAESAYAEFTDSDLSITHDLFTLPEEMGKSPFKQYEEHTRYWVKAPYAYISIVYNSERNDYRYVIVEPELDDIEVALMEEFDERLGTALRFEQVDEFDEERQVEQKVSRLEQKVLQLGAEYNISSTEESFHKILYYLERNYIFYNKIDPFINDPHVEDISCDGDEKYIFVYHQDYNDMMTNVKFARDELRSFIVQLAQRSGEHISAADPMCDASLPDGSRAQLTLGSEITTHGSTFTIRLFKDIPFTPIDLLKYKTFDLNQMSYLWLAIEHDKSLIFAGGTASGKTTSMNAISLFIPPKAKVVTLEDTREINLPHDNWIPGTTRDSVGNAGGDEISMYNLLEAALRQRPEYLVVGEIRGEEAQTLFQAMSTGHTTYSTMHADSVERAVGRLENPPINVPRAMVDSLDIMCIQQQVRIFDPETKKTHNVRRNVSQTEIIGMRSDGSFVTHQAYRRDAERDEFIEQLEDSHVLEDIREDQGWSHEDLEAELQERKDVLLYLVENDITEFEAVARTIQAYMIDSETIASSIRDDTFDPEEIAGITSVEFTEPEVELTELPAPKADEDPIQEPRAHDVDE